MNRCLISLACLFVSWPAGTALAQKPPARKPAAPLQRFHTIMRDIMRKHQIAGAALAIAVDGRLVLARGYGLANVAKGERVRANHLFCTASVSKAVDAVAVLKLAEDGKLDLDAPLMKVLARLRPLGKVVDPRVHKITVRHLLSHAAGWDVSKRGQPPASMLKQARALGVKGRISPEICYRIALTERLDFAPGTDSRYSNFGFNVLHLVVEEASGEGFEKYVRERVLAPMGIKRMRLEREDYGPGEVRRYAAGGRKELKGGYPVPAGETADRASGGNWVASAPDLVRFLTALDGSRGKPFLKRKTVAEMLAPPPPPFKRVRRATDLHVGLGWERVRRVGKGWQYSKAGGRAGVRAWIEHLPEGISWAVPFNTSFDKDGSGTLMGEAQKRIPEAIRQVKTWPARDLFQRKAR
jgi:CubicO group peptidase (beta-lactamase class C family)